ncbi:HAD-superfamily hydrolase, subfamily IA, variant 3 [Magnetospirillum sp. LM-5]|uniref:HAD family hydrolase n=1 Tax=Magnetospirillum sp. LM-5 TaxID=2681466 RepID=UPI0013825CAE|nr:HAD family phosphatase [Magnetospirillum sp. LM-5]CAA7615981.1 HAD-superfamily hydrolase, subfamily IA, variant 3 [Magnetospirillum sp. LM-5]
MNHTPPRALLLDMDGTLADSLGIMRLVFARLMAELGLPDTDQAFDSLNGPPLWQCAKILVARHGLGLEAAAIHRRWLDILDEEYPNVRAMDGARELLDEAHARHWRCCLVTSAGRAMAREWLARSGLAPLVPLVVGGDDVARGKPHPDPYLAGLALTGAAAGDSLAVEDSPAGAMAALAASIPTCLVGSHQPLPDGARRLASLAEVRDLLVSRSQP